MRLRNKYSLVLLALLCSYGISKGQLTNNGQTITTTGNISIYVNSNLINSGILNNEGQLTVTGNWLNSGTYDPRGGSVALSADTQQDILHNNSTFHNLELVGTGEKVVNDAVQISNQLNLNNALLTISTNGSLLIQSGAAISGASDNAYVNGPLLHEGEGRKEFPIGTSTNYLPIVLEDVQGTNPIVGAQAFEPNANATPGSDLESVSGMRYWQIIQNSGVFDGSLLTLSIKDDETIILDINNAVVAGSDQAGGTFNSLGQSAITQNANGNFVTSNQLSTTGFFTLGYSSGILSEELFIPNVFSPLATDPEDQTVKIYGGIIPDEFIFRIYDKWGGLVFETEDLDLMVNTGWQGTSTKTGAAVPAGPYLYSLYGKYMNGETIEKTGAITVLR